MKDGDIFTTLQGAEIVVTITSEGVFVNETKVAMADVKGWNGAVHVVDNDLLPGSVTAIDNSPLNLRKLNVYPIPARDYLEISFATEKDQKLQYSVYYLVGSIVDKGMIETFPASKTNHRISLSEYRNGYYTIVVKSGNDTAFKKFQVIK